MSRLDFFLTPELVFDALRTVDLAEGSRLIFRRFSKDGSDATIQVVDLADENNASMYLSGGFSEYYVSLGSIPEGSTDWGFIPRSADELLIFEGGRLLGRDLEITKLRVFSKRSRAKVNFTAIGKAIRARCKQKGLVTLSGASYKDIVYSPEIARAYRLRLSLATDSDEFTCSALTSPN